MWRTQKHSQPPRARRERLRVLRAPRSTNGETRFRLREGGPQPTSHGKDVYERIFGETP
jgi:hypothetical protein